MGGNMRLRNKKTGQIVEFNCGVVLESSDREDAFHSVKDIIEAWEDYTPKEPLIKDEKVRKAVRAWAEVNRTKYVWVSVAFKGIDITQDFEYLQLTEHKQSISFECEADFKSGTYTIAELCGEEEQ